MKDTNTLFRKTPLTVSAMFAILSGAASALFGYLGFSTFTSTIIFGEGPFYPALFMGSFGFVAFALTVSGAVMAMQRQRSELLVIGEAFGMLQGYIVSLAIGITESAISSTIWESAILAGLLIIIPSLIGLIFAAISERK